MSDSVIDAQKRYAEYLDAAREQRQQIEEDLRFSDPSNPDQWDPEYKHSRENDPGGKRPCMVFDQTGQFVANVANQVEKNPPSIHAIPVSSQADKKAAEQIDGRFRHIEHVSRAKQHYARAMMSAARTGVGYITVRPMLIDRSLNWQEPRIGSEADPLKVLFDPWSVETDGSDATCAYVLTSYPKNFFYRKWPNKECVSFGDTASMADSDDRESVLIAEEWLKTQHDEKCVMYRDVDGEQRNGTESEYVDACAQAMMELPRDNVYKETRDKVIWRRLSGVDVLEESEFLSEYIGVVPVYGYVSFIDGRMRYCGIPRRAREPQQAYNYHISEMLAYIQTAPKSPFIASARAVAGFEKLWDRSGKEARAWLPYNDVDELGAIAQPNRTPVSISLVNHEAAAAQALRDIQAAVGMYQANLGQRSNETSGVAIESRKEQGEASTQHFPSHLSESLGHVGNIVMEMDRRLMDTRREAPTISMDETPSIVTIDPTMREAYRKNQSGVAINPNVGKYGVRVVVGASFSTQRSQTNAAFTEIMRANRESFSLVLPFWAQTLDFPGSDKFAQAAAAMAPPAIKAILQPDGQDVDPGMLVSQLEQCKAALQEATQIAEEAQADADKAIAAQAELKRSAEAKIQELDIKAYEAETDRLKVTGASVEQIELITRDLISQMVAQPDPLPDGTMPQMPVPQSLTARPEALEALMQPIKPREDLLPIVESLASRQQELEQGMMQLAELIRKPRKRIPVRGPDGLIIEVIDSINEGA